MDSTQAFLQEYISDRIPITSAMGITVAEVSPLSITVTAKLAPNINHRDSAFGGSISTLGILAGWIILKHRCQTFEPKPTLVIQASNTQFLKPIISDYSSQVIDFTEADFAKFSRAYQRYGKARLTLKSTVTCEGEVCATHEGVFVGINRG